MIVSDPIRTVWPSCAFNGRHVTCRSNCKGNEFNTNPRRFHPPIHLIVDGLADVVELDFADSIVSAALCSGEYMRIESTNSSRSFRPFEVVHPLCEPNDRNHSTVLYLLL